MGKGDGVGKAALDRGLSVGRLQDGTWSEAIQRLVSPAAPGPQGVHACGAEHLGRGCAPVGPERRSPPKLPEQPHLSFRFDGALVSHLALRATAPTPGSMTGRLNGPWHSPFGDYDLEILAWNDHCLVTGSIAAPDEIDDVARERLPTGLVERLDTFDFELAHRDY
jgi:hypothetical protein